MQRSSLLRHLLYFVWDSLALPWDFAMSTRLAGLETSRDPSVSTSHHTYHTCLFVWIQRIWTQVPMPLRRMLYWTIHFSTPPPLQAYFGSQRTGIFMGRDSISLGAYRALKQDWEIRWQESVWSFWIPSPSPQSNSLFSPAWGKSYHWHLSFSCIWHSIVGQLSCFERLSLVTNTARISEEHRCGLHW